MTLRAALYARVSTEQQRERHTIKSQLRLLPEYALKQGWSIVETYTDDGYSGETIEGRPAFSRFLDDAAKGRFDVLLVIDEDRISRAKSDLTGALIYDALRENNIRIATPAGAFIDLTNEDQDFFAGLRLQMAKWEKRKVLSRMRRGRIEKWRQGKLAMGKCAFGYTYDKKSGIFALHPEHARTVQLIFELCTSQHLGLEGIAKHLNHRGIEAPAASQGTRHRRYSSAWAKSSVCKILNYQGYTGEIAYNVRITKQLNGKTHRLGRRPQEEWIRLTVPAIIDAHTFAAAHAALLQRKLLADRNKQREYLCGGMLHCVACGAKLCGEPSHGKTYYICYGRRKRDCTAPWLPSAAVDRAVWSRIEDILKSPTILTDALQMSEPAETPENEEQLARRLEENEAEETRLLRLYTKGKVSERRLDALLAQLQTERTALEAQRTQREQARKRREKAKRTGLSLHHLTRAVEGMSFAKKREILKTFIDGTLGTGIFITPQRQLNIVGTIPVPEDRLPGSEPNSSTLWPPAIATSTARLA